MYDWYGIADLLGFLLNLDEGLTFMLVLMLMLPVSEKQKMKRDEFQTFLFVGFLNRRQLEAAIQA